MVNMKDSKKEKNPFSDSSEIFESLFREATTEIKKETGKVVAKTGLKPKPRSEVKPKSEAKPKAPIKLELEREEPEPQPELLQEKPQSEAKPRIQTPSFKPRQESTRKPTTRTPGPDEEETGAELLSTRPLLRSANKEQEPKDEPTGEVKKSTLPKKKGKGSPVFKIILLLVLLAAGVGGASVYFGIIDLSDTLGWPEPAKKEVPKVAETKSSAAKTAPKPQQQTAPKPAQPAQPQAKPAEPPKLPDSPQTVQPPQASPKPTETVTPPPAKEVQAATAKPEIPVELGKAASPAAEPPPLVPPPQPPEVQVKPVLPAPPAVAKVETPPSAAQAPVKVEAPPAPLQPPVKSQAPAPKPSVPLVPKSEPKSPPAADQPPSVAKKAEIPQTGSQPKEVAVAKTVPLVSSSGLTYPYSVYLESVQSMDYLKMTMSAYDRQGLSTYWSKVHLGAKGTWYRLFTGYFRSAQEAEAFIQQKRIKDGEVKETRYSNLIGTFGTKQGAEAKALALASMGLNAYWIPTADGQVRLYSGAFLGKEGAEKNQGELNSRGIKSEIVER